MQRSDFFVGIILGAIVGAAVALLYTPDSGVNLRSQARDFAQNLRQEVRSASLTKRAELEQELEILREPFKPAED